MKTNKFFQLLTLVICGVALAFVTGCEGPEGPIGPKGDTGDTGDTGAQGPAGADANESCTQCHNDITTVLKAKTTQFNASAHSMATVYTNGGECAACHNNEGFLARMDDASTGDIYTYTGPAETPISCYTCHQIHQSYTAADWGLTYTDQVIETILGTKSPDVESVSFNDYGASNTCLQCHQARDRGDVPSPDSTDSLMVTSPYWGPHYGVQGNVLHSSGGVNIAGNATYPSFGNGHANMSCVDCHMHEGNHSLAVNFKACVDCHGNDAEAAVKALKTEIHDLQFELGALLFSVGSLNEVYEGGKLIGYAPAKNKNSAAQAAGVWNYMVTYQDHSYGTHKPSYIRALLRNSIAAVQTEIDENN
ncbi:MAG: hypothetical protein U5K79_05555 [Cyclobacteriaceae bacterium]|nr:hypothetical protein [Cyclobacteriaceae bacterium]